MRSFDTQRSAGFLALAFWLLGTPVSAHSTVIANFPSGSGVYSSLTPDGSGTFYGTAVYLGGSGGVFRLKKKAGGWGYQVLYSFNGSDGANPYGSLIRNPATGELYGTTQDGGPDHSGTIFSFKPSRHGGSLTVLHNFSGQDGALPSTGLLLDRKTGTLYGAAEYGGQYDCGTVYSLTPSDGKWTFTTLFDFRSDVDGCFPSTQVQLEAAPGTLIGATMGGYYGGGTVYQLANKQGQWTKTTLYNLEPGKDGDDPADIAVAEDGTIYGIAEKNGSRYGAVVFQLAPQHGKWTYRIIDKKGSGPVGLCLDKNSGTLYGTTTFSGVSNHGLLFKLTPMGSTWSETVLSKFKNVQRDGEHPHARPVFDPRTGTVYVTTTLGGANNGGTAYAVQ